ncbi:MAG: hypothetical protein IPO97_15300 [Sphingomonadales bacterium]|nr:hypothetical protein [Sphingomonadales bacterium]
MMIFSPAPLELRIRQPILAIAGSMSIEAIRVLFFVSPFLLSLMQLLGN